VTNVEVLERVQTNLKFVRNMKKRKLEYAGHVLRGSSGKSHLMLLESLLCDKNPWEGQD